MGKALKATAVGAALTLASGASSSCFDQAPDGFGRTPPGPGATVRYDLGHKPLPAIPLPIDTATWPDPTSRTGLRVNASLIAPTALEQKARERFDQLEGWGTFAPISVSFDLPGRSATQGFEGPALDLANVRARHQGDDYDFANDAIYLVNLETGVPMVLDVGAGNFTYTLKKLDRYWPNDPRQSERNLLFDTVDETARGSIRKYDPALDSDFDGVLDQPNFENLEACPARDASCDDPGAAEYGSAECLDKRRKRDRCVADNLLTWYERETDTLIVRPLLPLDEMTRYAVVLTDRLVDGLGNPVRSPFEQVFHATQRSAAERVAEIIDDSYYASYFGDISGSGIGRVAFVWSFTTQPTVDDSKRLRDGLYGQGPFARWAAQYPPEVELQRLVGLNAGLAEGATDPPGWQQSPLGQQAGCATKADNLWIIRYEGLRSHMRLLLEQGFGVDAGPDLENLLRKFDYVSHMVVGTYRAPFLLEGGPSSTDPNAAFNINYVTGEAEETSDTVQFWMIVPKETEAHQQPFDVNIFGHGYTSNFVEQILYAGSMAEHGLATIGINAMGHGLVFNLSEAVAANAAAGGACYAPAVDALTLGRARDLDHDGELESGGDFWSSYLFHTRDGVRQSILDHLQLVRIMRSFGEQGSMRCRDDGNPDQVEARCDFDGDGQPELAGDFDGDGRVDAGGPEAKYGTWGESLGGILSGIHGAIDAYVTSAVPGSGGGGLTDIGVRSFQGGVIEAVLLRLWGPLLVSIPAQERKTCEPGMDFSARCTVCAEGEMSLRWVLPDVDDTGEVEIDCLTPSQISSSTLRVVNVDNSEVQCARVSDEGRFRLGLPASTGDEVVLQFWEGKDVVDSYDGCNLVGDPPSKHVVQTWGVGRFAQGTVTADESASCHHSSCAGFQGRFFGEGTPLVAPGEGLGLGRQTPGLRRFIALAQAALEPGDPVSFAPYYALKPMTDPYGQVIAPHAVLTLNTIGDQNVPLNSGIAFARATGALPFLRPNQAALYPDYVDYITPQALFDALGGRTPNQHLIENHVVEGITELARHPASEACASSQNADPEGTTYLDADDQPRACYPSGCSESTESSGDTRLCLGETSCDYALGVCVPRPLGTATCERALFDSDDLDEGTQQYFEQAAAVPQRLARLTASARDLPLSEVWAPRLRGTPHGSDGDAYEPRPAPGGRLTALLNAYIVPEGEHTFVNGNPCQAFDHGTYLTNLVATFFASDGTDLYYLSHPETHRCLQAAEWSCSSAP